MKFSPLYLLLLGRSIYARIGNSTLLNKTDAHMKLPAFDATTNEYCTAGLVVKQGDHKMETSLSCFLSDDTVYDVNVDQSFIEDFMNGPYKSGEFEFTVPKGAVFDRNALAITIPDKSNIALKKKKNGMENGRNSFNKKVRSVLVVRVEANDASTSKSQSFLSDSVFGTDGDSVNLKTQMNACSHGQLSFTPTLDRPSVDSRPSITKGATTVSVNSSTSDGDAVMRNAITHELFNQFGVAASSLADHVLYCMPPNTISHIAYGYIGGWLTVYSDNWCTYPSAQMHEVGHNLGLSHSGEGNNEYGNGSCMMGYAFSEDDGPRMCYGAPKAWQLDWYQTKRVEISESNPAYSGELAGYIEDVNNTDVPPMLIKIVVDSSLVDYYVYFNRAEGFMSGTREGKNQVLISQWNSNGYNDSYLQAKLSEGDSWDIPGFKGSVTVTSIGTRARVEIILTQVIMPISTSECAEFAENVGRDYCYNCGYTNWGENGNARPKGCFFDHNYNSYVFYNSGGEQYNYIHEENPFSISYQVNVTPGKGCTTRITPEECERYANYAGKRYCYKCGYAGWGENGNARPKGCFIDYGYQSHVFYNPGGDNYDGTSENKQSICNPECYTGIDSVECEEYAQKTGKEYCYACGYKNWGDNGNSRPKGCFIDDSYTSYVFYNPGGDDYHGSSQTVHPVCTSFQGLPA